MEEMNINKKRILQAGHELFDSRGYRSVTVKDLADKLGMSKKTIYQYFSSKEEIATEVVEESMLRLNQATDIAEYSSSDPLSVIKAIFNNLRDESMRFGPLFLNDIEKYLPELSYKYKVFKSEKREHIKNILKEAQDAGIVKDVPIALTTEILGVCLKAIVKSDEVYKNGYSREDVINLFLNIFCNGIADSEKSKY